MNDYGTVFNCRAIQVLAGLFAVGGDAEPFGELLDRWRGLVQVQVDHAQVVASMHVSRLSLDYPQIVLASSGIVPLGK
jgi:hypothetical protein